jgi:hypothetical protein
MSLFEIAGCRSGLVIMLSNRSMRIADPNGKDPGPCVLFLFSQAGRTFLRNRRGFPLLCSAFIQGVQLDRGEPSIHSGQHQCGFLFVLSMYGTIDQHELRFRYGQAFLILVQATYINQRRIVE